MAAAPLILMGVGAAAGAYGTWRQGMNEAENLKAQASAQKLNAANYEELAAAESRQAVQNEYLQRRRARAVFGEQRAALATSGLSSQTAADIMADSQAEAELDALNIRYEGLMKRRSALYDAALAKWQAKELKRGAKEAKVGTYLGVFGGLASAGGNMYAAGSGLKTTAPKGPSILMGNF